MLATAALLLAAAASPCHGERTPPDAATASPSSARVRSTVTPPLLNSPVYSLATRCEDGRTGMNIHTYATPVGATPVRKWAVGLYRGTQTHENFAREGRGILQLLRPQHASLVTMLGGSSGRDIDKRSKCAELGFEWITLARAAEAANTEAEGKEGANDGAATDDPLLLPGCAAYVKLRQEGALIDAGGHEVAICVCEAMYADTQVPEEERKSHLSTAELRAMGLISEAGRAILDGK
mmetsp:Transcript_6895/g.13643  ORF Transcript_6895/g.13643 Transcript_6895/m.13643 type:complete len:237 (-) Transcript_6895:50-760(-)